MLVSLSVRDLALIRRLDVDFTRSFTVLTGETGAGKSLVLDSLNLFLTQKGAKELVRHGAEKMEVSLLFGDLSPQTLEALREVYDTEGEEEFQLTRIVTAEGKSTCRINGRAVSFAVLSAVASQLVTIHGQMSARGLLDEKNHLFYLDALLSEQGKAALAAYTEAYREYRSAAERLSALEEKMPSQSQTLDYLEYQMAEIARIKPRVGEDEELEERLFALQNSEKRYAALHTADRALSGGEKGKGAVYLLEAAAARLNALPEKENQRRSEELYDLVHRARELASEVSFALSEIGSEDPGEEMDRIRKRIDLLFRLKQKYGETLEEVIGHFRSLKEKRDLTLSLKDDIKRAKEDCKKQKEALEGAAEALGKERRLAAEALEQGVLGVLSFLDMPRLRFRVLFEGEEFTSRGKGGVRFAISPNQGEGLRPLASIASGGELSRLMLSLQLKLGQTRSADTFVFDEIDTGISGATAQKIGICLRELAEERQVFCVTHSPQVATLAGEHFLVEKRETEGRTETGLKKLSEEESLMEVSRLLGGQKVGRQAREAAENLRREGLLEWKKVKNELF